jgi:ankyrin repeat protein
MDLCVESIEELIKTRQGMNIFNRTALMNATIKKNVKQVAVIIDNGDDVNATDCKGFTALHFACENKSVNIVNMLVLNGAKKDARALDGRTPLMMVRDVRIADFLIQKGANIYIFDNEGKTALIHAAFSGLTHVVDLLIKKGSIVSFPDMYGYTALYWAFVGANFDTMITLLENGANPEDITFERGQDSDNSDVAFSSDI